MQTIKEQHLPPDYDRPRILASYLAETVAAQALAFQSGLDGGRCIDDCSDDAGTFDGIAGA